MGSRMSMATADRTDLSWSHCADYAPTHNGDGLGAVVRWTLRACLFEAQRHDSARAGIEARDRIEHAAVDPVDAGGVHRDAIRRGLARG